MAVSEGFEKKKLSIGSLRNHDGRKEKRNSCATIFIGMV